MTDHNPHNLPIPDPFKVKSEHVAHTKSPLLFYSMEVAVFVLLYASGLIAGASEMPEPLRTIVSFVFMLSGMFLLGAYMRKVRHHGFMDGIKTGIVAHSDYVAGELDKTFKRWKEQQDSTTTPTE